MKCRFCKEEMQESYTFNDNAVRVRDRDYCTHCSVRHREEIKALKLKNEKRK